MPADEDRLKTQLAEVEGLIISEVEEFYQRYPTRRPVISTAVEKELEATDTSNETVGAPQLESPSASNIQTDTTNNPVQESSPEQKPAAAEKDGIEEHNGEVVVVAEEDTVIY